MTDYYFAEECKGFDCDPHHFPQDYGNKFHFTRDTFIELWSGLLKGGKEYTLPFLSKQLFAGINPSKNLETICKAFKELQSWNPLATSQFHGVEPPEFKSMTEAIMVFFTG